MQDVEIDLSNPKTTIFHFVQVKQDVGSWHFSENYNICTGIIMAVWDGFSAVVIISKKITSALLEMATKLKSNILTFHSFYFSRYRNLFKLHNWERSKRNCVASGNQLIRNNNEIL